MLYIWVLLFSWGGGGGGEEEEDAKTPKTNLLLEEKMQEAILRITLKLPFSI